MADLFEDVTLATVLAEESRVGIDLD
jgi:hypothetical protein